MNDILMTISESSYEKKNLSYKFFKDLDFSTDISPISFYRSDFRGAKFQSVVFYKNNFDLADFIANVFINTEFSNVNFGNCSFKNGYFNKCHFNKNLYADISFQDCTFVKCTFQKETFRMTMIGCTFQDCQFIDCIYDQCTTGNLIFKYCTIIKCEMSTMCAEDFEISDCIIRDTYLGACFLGTYLIKNVDMNLLAFKYRGEVIGVSDNYFESLKQDLLEQNRFFEWLNLSILAQLPSSNYGTIVKKCLESLANEANPNVQAYNINGIYKVIEFYMGSDMLDYLSVLQLKSLLFLYDSSQLSPSNQLLYQERLYRLQSLLDQCAFDINYVKNIPEVLSCVVTIHCNDSSFTEAEAKINNFFNNVNENFLDNSLTPPLISILSEEKGSVIITIATSLLLGLMAAHTIRAIHTNICQIRLEQARTNKEIQFINSSNSPAVLSKAVSLSEKHSTDMDDKIVNRIFNDLGKDYIIDYVIKYFLK